MRMNALISLTAISIFSIFSLWAKPEAKITVHAVSDQGQSMPNLPISLSTFDYWQPGEGFGKDVYTNLSQKTDLNGLATFIIPSARGDMGIGTDYPLKWVYQGGRGYEFKTNSGNKWQPWNPTVELIVKPIINPIAMYAEALRLSLPAKSSPVGFDLEAGDWVVPYGKGTISDFIFELAGKIPFVSRNNPYDVTNTLSFSNKGDGIQSVMVPLNSGSALRLPRYAPTDGYQPTLAQELSLSGNNLLSGSDGEDQNYFFRVRTVLDETGKIKSALYGKISGPIICGPQGYIQFTYYLNPNSNDRNMEFDPTKNLFNDLSIDQQVTAP